MGRKRSQSTPSRMRRGDASVAELRAYLDNTRGIEDTRTPLNQIKKVFLRRRYAEEELERIRSGIHIVEQE